MTRVAGVYLWKGDECVDLFTDYGGLNVYVDFEDKCVIVYDCLDDGENGTVAEWHNLAMYNLAVFVNKD